MRRFLVLLCAIALLAGAAPARAGKQHRAQVGFWTGQNTTQCLGADPTTCPRDLSAYTPAVWDALRKGHGALYFALLYGVDFGPGAFRHDAEPVLRKATSLGVTVKAWFMNPLSQGTWSSENNADLHEDALKAFVSWRTARHLKIDEVVFDLEIPAGTKLVVGKGPIDPAHQCAAIRTYARAISWGHRHGVVVSGSPMPFLLDDLDNGDIALADALDAAPLIPRAYDHVYLQAYRTYSNTGADYLAGYLRRVRHYFGTAGEVSPGDTTMGPPYQQVESLVADVRMTVALGATAIPVFELASVAQKFGATGVRQVLDAGRHPMSAAEVAAATTTSPLTTANLTFFRALDTAATAASLAPNAYPSGCPVRVDPLRR